MKNEIIIKINRDTLKTIKLAIAIILFVVGIISFEIISFTTENIHIWLLGALTAWALMTIIDMGK